VSVENKSHNEAVLTFSGISISCSTVVPSVGNTDSSSDAFDEAKGKWDQCWEIVIAQ
jgi:hypothetical protein